MFNFEINILAVLLAAVVSFVFSFIFYAPAVFGKMYMQYTNKNPDDPKNKEGMGKKIVGGLISNFIFALVFAILISSLAVSTVGGVITLSFLVWIGFVTTIYFGAVLWNAEDIRAFYLNSVHNLLMTLIIGFTIFYI